MSNKIKMLYEGQKCRKRYTPVIRRYPKPTPLRSNRSFTFKSYLYCPNCKQMYMLESEKQTNNKMVTLNQRQLSFC